MTTSERLFALVCLVGSILGIAAFFLWPMLSAEEVVDYSPPARTGDLPPIAVRYQPVQVRAWGGFESAVDNDALYYALDTSVPYSGQPTIAQLLHELRLWGAHSPFPVIDDLVGRSGMWTVGVLLDNSKCEEHVKFAESFGGFLIRTRYGTRVLTAADPGLNTVYAQGHYGQLLQVLAEVGAPLGQSVLDDGGERGTIEDLIRDAAARYSPKDEQEFTAVAFACWLEPGAEWMDRFGNSHTMDDVARALARTRIGDGTCYGGHLPYAMMMVLRVNELEPIIATETKEMLEARLKEFSRVLTRSQLGDGSWDYNWSGNEESDSGALVSTSQEYDRITCTGHHLEWIALAPPELRPADEVVTSAINALAKLLKNMPTKDEQSFKDMLPASHGARALSLLRNEEPYEFWEREFKSRNPDMKIEENRAPDYRGEDGN